MRAIKYILTGIIGMVVIVFLLILGAQWLVDKYDDRAYGIMIWMVICFLGGLMGLMWYLEKR